MALTGEQRAFFEKAAAAGLTKEQAKSEYKKASRILLRKTSPLVAQVLDIGDTARAGVAKRQKSLEGLTDTNRKLAQDMAKATGRPLENFATALKESQKAAEEGEFFAEITEGTKEGVGKLKRGTGDVFEAITGEDEKGELTAAERVIRAGGGVGDVIGGGLQTLFTIPSELVTRIPGIGPAIEKGFEKLHEVTGGGTEFLIEQLEIDPQSEQAEALRKLTGAATDLAVIKGAKKAGEVAKPVVEAKVKPQLAKLEKAARLKAGKAKEALGGNKASIAIVESVNKMIPTKVTQFMKKAKKSHGDWLVERNIIAPREATVTALFERANRMKNDVDAGLAKIEGTFKPTAARKILEDMIDKFKKEDARADLSLMKRRLKKFEKEGLTMPELQSIKRAYERNVKLDFLKENNPSGVKKANNRDSQIREFMIEEGANRGFKNLREVNREISNSIFLAEAIWEKFGRQKVNNPFSLTDNIFLLGGAIEPSVLAALGLKKVLSSETIQAGIAKKLRIGEVKPELKVPQERIKLKAKQIRGRQKS